MQTIDVNDLVSASFEPCTSFASADTTPVCAACGWLDGEHEPAIAEVLSLPIPAPAQKRAKRLAS
jgi:hypothetical protein